MNKALDFVFLSSGLAKLAKLGLQLLPPNLFLQQMTVGTVWNSLHHDFLPRSATSPKFNIDTKNDEPWKMCISGFKHGVILGIFT